MIRITFVEDFEYFSEATEVLRNRKVEWLAAAALIIGVGASSVEGYLKHDPRWWVPLPVLGAFCFIFWFFFLSRVGRRQSLKRGLRGVLKEPPCQVVWEFNSEGADRITHETRCHFAWSSFEGLEEKADGWLLRVNAASCFWFPKLFFLSGQELSAFVSMCRQNGVPCGGRSK